MATQPKHAAARRPVSAGQLKELLNQIQSGFDFDTFQMFLARHGDPLARFEPKSWSPEPIFPSHGEALEALLSDAKQTKYYRNPREGRRFLLEPIKAFYPAYQAALCPPIPGLKGRLHASVFWRRGGLKKIRVVTLSEVNEATFNPRHELALRLKHTNNHLFGTDLREALLPELDDERELALQVFDDFSMGAENPNNLSRLIRRLQDWTPEQKHEFAHAEDWRDAVADACSENLSDAVTVTLALTATNRPIKAKLLRSTLALFLEGNIPFGYDQDGTLLVICGDK